MVEDCEHFTVFSETNDFVAIKVNMGAVFNDAPIREHGTVNTLQFIQYLLDEHGLMMLCPNGTGKLFCRKVKEESVD